MISQYIDESINLLKNLPQCWWSVECLCRSFQQKCQKLASFSNVRTSYILSITWSAHHFSSDCLGWIKLSTYIHVPLRMNCWSDKTNNLNKWVQNALLMGGIKIVILLQDMHSHPATVLPAHTCIPKAVRTGSPSVPLWWSRGWGAHRRWRWDWRSP